jgi:hypothetical protein
MPVTYTIDAAQSLIRTVCTEPLMFEEVLEHFDELQADPRCPERPVVLLDLTGVTSFPMSGQVRDVAARVGKVKGIRFGRVAIAASHPAMFGMARVFGVFAEAHFGDSRVFKKLAEAEAWLKKPLRV